MAGNIGKYQLIEEIGRGGFGIVYRAFDPTVNRTVAIKVLTVAGDEELLGRFRNEAAAAGNLHHPNIVTVHEFGESEQGMPFMVMQFLEGETLQSIIVNARPLSLLQKMSIMWQVAEGLNHAHEHGVVHRDVKPPNIMILPDESVQMMDFGIARMTASTKHQTRTGFVVGTPLYMAPEQFLPNKTVDHRADIWAYGVIYYELLTGRNPFAAPEDATILYQIAHVEPPPLRNLVDSLPPALEDAIHKLLVKDADFRYGSLRDLQFDLQPILVDLKRERAVELMREAGQLAVEERLEEAQSILQKILQLDPANREAHALLGNVKQRLMRRQIQPKIDNLLARADQEQDQRNYAGAVDALEQAVRLSPNDTNMRSRLEQARGLLEQSRRCEKLLADAQSELQRQNLTGALRMASEAVKMDPGNSTAGRLLSNIQQELESREAKRKVEEGINKARGFMLLQQYDEAIAILTKLQGAADRNPLINELLANASREQAEQERRQRRAKDIGAAREALKQRRFEDAATKLEALASDFTGDVEVEQLLRYAREELAYQKRTEAVLQIVKEAETLHANAEYDTALRLIERSLGEYPGEPSLVRMVQSITVARAAWQRRLTVDRCLVETAQLRKEGQFEKALQRVRATLAEFNDEGPLLTLRAELEREWQAAQRAESLRRAIDQAQSHLQAGNPARAIAVLEPAARENPGDSTVSALLATARGAKQEQELAHVVETALRSAGDREQRRDLRGALKVIELALSQVPDSAALASAAERLRASTLQAERLEAINQKSAAIESSIRSGDFARAIQVAEAARREFPEEDRFEQLIEKARGGQRAAELRATVSRIRELHRSDQLEECKRLLDDVMSKAGHETAIQDLHRQVTNDVVKRCLSTAESKLRQGQFDAAAAEAQTAQRWNPGESATADLLKRIERERHLAAVDARVAELCNIPDYETAAKALKVARQRYPDEPRLAAREREIEAILQEERVRREHDSAVDEAHHALEQGDFARAESLARQALVVKPGDEAAASLIERARVQLEIATALDEAGRLASGGDLIRAKDVVTNILVRFPADARLQERLEDIRGRLFNEALEQARRHLEDRRWDDAAEAAQTALNYRSRDAAATALLSKAKQSKLLADRIGSIRRTVSEHGAVAALESIAAARRDYGNVPELEALDTHIREQAYAESVGKAKAELEEQRITEARKAAQTALHARPNDATATSLLRTIDLEQEITLGVEAIDHALKTSDIAQARSLVSNGLRMYPGEPRFSAMQQRLAEQVRTSIARERENVARLLSEHQFERALVLIGDVRARFDSAQDLEAERKTAAAGLEGQQLIEQEVVRAQQALRAGDLTQARILITNGIRLYPGESRFKNLEGELAERIRNALALERKNVARLMSERQFEKAVTLINDVQTRLGSTTELEADKKAASAGLEEQRKADAEIARVQQALQTGDLTLARTLIDDGRRVHPGEPRFADLERQLSERLRNSVAQERKNVAKLISERQFEKALAVISDLQSRFGASPELEADQKAAATGLDNQRKAEQELVRIQQSLQTGDLAQARSMLAGAVRLYPGEPRLKDLERQVLELEKQRKAEEAVEVELQKLDDLKNAGHAAKVRSGAKALLGKKLGERRAEELLRWAEAELAVSRERTLPQPPADTREVVEPRPKGVLYGSIAAGAVIGAIIIGVLFSRLREPEIERQRPNQSVESPAPVQPAPSVPKPAETPSQQAQAANPAPVTTPQVAAPKPQATSPQTTSPQTTSPQTTGTQPQTTASQTPVPQTAPAKQVPYTAGDPGPGRVTPSPVTQPPKQASAPTADPGPGRVTPPVAQQPTAPWGGSRSGKISWSGAAIPPNGRLVLSTSGVVEGGGELEVGAMPPFSRVNLSVVSKGNVSLAVNGPSQIVLTNVSGSPIYFVQIAWELKQ